MVVLARDFGHYRASFYQSNLPQSSRHKNKILIKILISQPQQMKKLQAFLPKTLLRNANFLQSHNARFSVITNDKHFFLAQDIANQVGIFVDCFLLESIAKNTAPALCFAALNALKSMKMR